MKYILKNKDIVVLEFEVQPRFEKGDFKNEIRQEFNNIRILNKKLLPLNFYFWQNDTKEALQKWIKHRKAPSNRQFIQKIIKTYSNDWQKELPMDYIDISLALSLNDSYWIIPAKSNYKWQDYNLYKNEFDKALELIAFSGEFSQKVSGLTSSPEYTTNGNLAKCWHRENGQIYLYKGSSKEYANGGKEAFSEYYMAQIADILDFNHTPYDLVKFHDKMVSTCPIFTSENEGYMPIYYLLTQDELSSKKSEKGLQAISKIYGKEHFENLMLFDALICNTDRHLGNFGMIIDNNTNAILRPAPIFDNGISIFDKATIQDLSNLKDLVNGLESYFEYTFDEQLERFVRERHIPKLEKLKSFEFKKHKDFNLSDEWLESIQKVIQNRANLALKFAYEKQNIESTDDLLKAVESAQKVQKARVNSKCDDSTQDSRESKNVNHKRGNNNE